MGITQYVNARKQPTTADRQNDYPDTYCVRAKVAG